MKRILSTASRAAFIVALLVLAGFAIRSYPAAAEAGLALPAPAVDTPPGQATSAVAVLAGGCFWGVQGVFQHVKGVTSAVSGYAGGDKRSANYEIVSRGVTGHAESVQVTFDPRQISYGRLLQIFFSVAHDPTELNRQGPDIGTAVSLGDLPHKRRSSGHRKGLHRPARSGPCFKKAIVTTNRAGPDFLSGRGLSSGLPDAAPDRSPTSSSTTCRRSRTCNSSSPTCTVRPRCSSRDCSRRSNS